MLRMFNYRNFVAAQATAGSTMSDNFSLASPVQLFAERVASSRVKVRKKQQQRGQKRQRVKPEPGHMFTHHDNVLFHRTEREWEELMRMAEQEQMTLGSFERNFRAHQQRYGVNSDYPQDPFDTEDDDGAFEAYEAFRAEQTRSNMDQDGFDDGDDFDDEPSQNPQRRHHAYRRASAERHQSYTPRSPVPNNQASPEIWQWLRDLGVAASEIQPGEEVTVGWVKQRFAERAKSVHPDLVQPRAKAQAEMLTNAAVVARDRLLSSYCGKVLPPMPANYQVPEEIAEGVVTAMGRKRPGNP